MGSKKFRVIVLTHGGAERLIELLSASPGIEIAGVFVERKTIPVRSFRQKIERSVRYDGYLATMKKIVGNFWGAAKSEENAISKNQDLIKSFVEELNIPFFFVDDYHTEDARDRLKKTEADLGIIYGTNIVKKSVFEIPRMGSINLHQGHAPYYRGGPTVFWELFNGEREIGITVHFVAEKVDTGDIVLQELIPLEYDYDRYGLNYSEFLEDIRALLKEPSARMMADAAGQIAAGIERREKQNIELGKRYRLPVKKEQDAMVRVLRARRSRKNEPQKSHRELNAQQSE